MVVCTGKLKEICRKCWKRHGVVVVACTGLFRSESTYLRRGTKAFFSSIVVKMKLLRPQAFLRRQ